MTDEQMLESLIRDVKESLTKIEDVNLKLYKVPMEPLTWDEYRRLREHQATVLGVLWFYQTQLNRARDAKKWYQIWK